MPKRIYGDLAGQKFGRLTVLESVYCPKNRRTAWKCACDCGSVTFYQSYLLVKEGKVSCGCVGADQRRARAIHRLQHSSEYGIWRSIRRRCEKERAQGYARYGGRGLTVCERWSEFAKFLADVGPRPSEAHSLDRIDNDKGYEPGNVRWATRLEQGNNTSGNFYITYDGRTRSVSDWAREVGLGPHTIRQRVLSGWAVERALFTPMNSEMAWRRQVRRASPGITAGLVA